MDESNVDPLQVVQQLVLMIVEARTPDQSAKGRVEGPHCALVGGGNPSHHCSVEREECVRADQFCKSASRLWTNGIPVCVDILLFPSCTHGKQAVAVMEGTVAMATRENTLLVERWMVEVERRRAQQVLPPSLLLQAVRSYLHFSQISSWLYSNGGLLPGLLLVYRINGPGEESMLDFPDLPDTHTFPVCTASRQQLKVRVNALNRLSSLPMLMCVDKDKWKKKYRSNKDFDSQEFCYNDSKQDFDGSQGNRKRKDFRTERLQNLSRKEKGNVKPNDAFYCGQNMSEMKMTCDRGFSLCADPVEAVSDVWAGRLPKDALMEAWTVDDEEEEMAEYISGGARSFEGGAMSRGTMSCSVVMTKGDNDVVCRQNIQKKKKAAAALVDKEFEQIWAQTQEKRTGYGGNMFPPVDFMQGDSGDASWSKKFQVVDCVETNPKFEYLRSVAVFDDFDKLSFSDEDVDDDNDGDKSYRCSKYGMSVQGTHVDRRWRSPQRDDVRSGKTSKLSSNVTHVSRWEEFENEKRRKEKLSGRNGDVGKDKNRMERGGDIAVVAEGGVRRKKKEEWKKDGEKDVRIEQMKLGMTLIRKNDNTDDKRDDNVVVTVKGKEAVGEFKSSRNFQKNLDGSEGSDIVINRKPKRELKTMKSFVDLDNKKFSGPKDEPNSFSQGVTKHAKKNEGTPINSSLCKTKDVQEVLAAKCPPSEKCSLDVSGSLSCASQKSRFETSLTNEAEFMKKLSDEISSREKKSGHSRTFDLPRDKVSDSISTPVRKDQSCLVSSSPLSVDVSFSELDLDVDSDATPIASPNSNSNTLTRSSGTESLFKMMTERRMQTQHDFGTDVEYCMSFIDGYVKENEEGFHVSNTDNTANGSEYEKPVVYKKGSLSEKERGKNNLNGVDVGLKSTDSFKSGKSCCGETVVNGFSMNVLSASPSTKSETSNGGAIQNNTFDISCAEPSGIKTGMKNDWAKMRNASHCAQGIKSGVFEDDGKLYLSNHSSSDSSSVTTSRKMFQENLLPLASYDAETDTFKKVEEAMMGANILHSPKVLLSCDIPEDRKTPENDVEKVRKYIDFERVLSESQFFKSKIQGVLGSHEALEQLTNMLEPSSKTEIDIPEMEGSVGVNRDGSPNQSHSKIKNEEEKLVKDGKKTTKRNKGGLTKTEGVKNGHLSSVVNKEATVTDDGHRPVGENQNQVEQNYNLGGSENEDVVPRKTSKNGNVSFETSHRVNRQLNFSAGPESKNVVGFPVQLQRQSNNAVASDVDGFSKCLGNSNQSPTTRDLKNSASTALAAQSSPLPSVSLPFNSTLPSVSLPSSSRLPSVSLPSSSTLPSASLPSNSTLPSASLPSNSTLPSASLPSNSTLPSASLPSNSTLPSASLPSNSTLPSALLLSNSSLPRRQFPYSSSVSIPVRAAPSMLSPPSSQLRGITHEPCKAYHKQSSTQSLQDFFQEKAFNSEFVSESDKDTEKTKQAMPSTVKTQSALKVDMFIREEFPQGVNVLKYGQGIRPSLPSNSIQNGNKEKPCHSVLDPISNGMCAQRNESSTISGQNIGNGDLSLTMTVDNKNGCKGMVSVNEIADEMMQGKGVDNISCRKRHSVNNLSNTSSPSSLSVQLDSYSSFYETINDESKRNVLITCSNGINRQVLNEEFVPFVDGGDSSVKSHKKKSHVCSDVLRPFCCDEMVASKNIKETLLPSKSCNSTVHNDICIESSDIHRSSHICDPSVDNVNKFSCKTTQDSLWNHRDCYDNQSTGCINNASSHSQQKHIDSSLHLGERLVTVRVSSSSITVTDSKDGMGKESSRSDYCLSSDSSPREIHSLKLESTKSKALTQSFDDKENDKPSGLKQNLLPRDDDSRNSSVGLCLIQNVNNDCDVDFDYDYDGRDEETGDDTKDEEDVFFYLDENLDYDDDNNNVKSDNEIEKFVEKRGKKQKYKQKDRGKSNENLKEKCLSSSSSSSSSISLSVSSFEGRASIPTYPNSSSAHNLFMSTSLSPILTAASSTASTTIINSTSLAATKKSSASLSTTDDLNVQTSLGPQCDLDSAKVTSKRSRLSSFGNISEGWDPTPPSRSVSSPNCMEGEVRGRGHQRSSGPRSSLLQQSLYNIAKESKENRRSTVTGASMVFNSRTSLPTQSSPAPLKRNPGGKFDYDSTLVSVKAIKNAFSCSRLVLGDKERDEDEENKRTLSTSAPASTNCLLGNFEESILNGRIDPVGTVSGFTAEIGASGSFCPKHIHLPVSAFFFDLSDDKAPSPYLGHINLRSVGSKKGYHIPKKGTVQVTLFNPNKTVVKMFVVMYDLTDMPASSQTFIRQRTMYVPCDRNSTAPSYLRYLIHLRCSSTRSGKIYLHTDIRLIFARHKLDIDAKTVPYEMKSFTELPKNPKYSPKK